MKKFFVLVGFLSATLATAADRPGGLTRTAVNLKAQTYELLLSPAYTIAPGGAYLTSELRFQPSEDLGLGFGFGAGEIGFNFGGNAVWHILPDVKSQPGFALMGGLYFNRVAPGNYFVVRISPLVSKQFTVGWGKVTPYAGLHLAPSFRLGQAENDFSLKGSTGVEFDVTGWNGLHIWTEFGLGLHHSAHELVLGVSYPFAALGA